ncbi:MAG: hypothetical protein ABIF88_04130 [archaeon]
MEESPERIALEEVHRKRNREFNLGMFGALSFGAIFGGLIILSDSRPGTENVEGTRFLGDSAEVRYVRRDLYLGDEFYFDLYEGSERTLREKVGGVKFYEEI